MASYYKQVCDVILCVIIVGIAVINVYSATASFSYYYHLEYSNVKYKGPALMTSTERSSVACGIKCGYDEDCVGFLFTRSNRSCQLLNTDIGGPESKDDNFTFSSGTDLYIGTDCTLPSVLGDENPSQVSTFRPGQELGCTSGGHYSSPGKARCDKTGSWRTPSSFSCIAGRCSCIWIPSVELNWTDAKQHCEAEGGSLIVPENGGAHDPAGLVQFVQSLNLGEDVFLFSGIWFGGSDLEQEGSWKWFSGSSINTSVPGWAPDEPSRDPNEHCGLLNGLDNFQLIDVVCYLQFYFACGMFYNV